MDTIESDSAESRAEMQCPNCWEKGLVVDETFAEQETDPDEKIINATRCPNEECETGRVKPAEIERQYDTGGSGVFGSGFEISDLFRKSVVGVLAVVLVLALWVGVPLFTGESPVGEGEATSDTAQSDGFGVEYTQSGPVITNGDKYITANETVSDTPYYYETPSNAHQTYSEALGDSQNTTEESNNGSSNNQSDSGPNNNNESTQQESGTSDVQVVEVDQDDNSAENTSKLTDEDEVGGQTVSAINNTDNFRVKNPDEDKSALIITEPDGDEIAESATLTGAMLSKEYEPVSNATVTLPATGASVTTGGDGEYLFDNIPPGEYTVSADTEGNISTVQFAVTDNGKITVSGTPQNAVYTTKSNTDIVRDGRISIVESGQYEVSITGTGSDMDAPLSFSSQKHAEDVTVTLTPVQKPVTKSYTAATTDTEDDGYLLSTISLPDYTPATQDVSIASTPTTKEISFNGTANGTADSETQITVPGNIYPTGVEIRLESTGSTEDPTVKMGNTTVASPDGELSDPYETFVADETLLSGSQTVNFTTDKGDVAYNISLTARARAAAGTVVLNDKEWDLKQLTTTPVGPTHSASNTHQTQAGVAGENNLQLNADPAGGMEPTLRFKLTHGGAFENSTNPKITVYNPNGGVNSMMPPSDSLEDGELTEQVTLSLPQSWFGEGTNTVQVTSQNGTEVTAELTATGVGENTEQFD
jgi:hypothetical protein